MPISRFYSLKSLLLSTAILLLGHGLQLTLLPLQALKFGWSQTAVGLTGSAYYLGFMAGCLAVARVIRRVGHIRTFSIAVSLAAIAILGLSISDHYWFWLLCRFLTGCSLAAFYTVIESWLNDQTSNQERGQVLAVYTLICLGAMAIAQPLVGSGAELGTLFPIAAILIISATLPIALTMRPQPDPPLQARFTLATAYNASQVGFVCAGLSGLVMGLIWSLGVAEISQASGDPQLGAHFILSVLAGGLLMQFPAGRLSDHFDRRRVLLALCVLGLISAVVWLLYTPKGSLMLLIGIIVGASAQPIYSIAIAHANDNADGQFLEIASGMLMINGLCAMLGPVVHGLLHLANVPQALVLQMLGAFAIAAVWTLVRMRVHTVERAHFEPFQPLPKTALEVVELDPRMDVEPTQQPPTQQPPSGGTT